LHVHSLDEELDDARLLGREQLVPDRGEVGARDRDLALGDLVVLSLRRSPSPRHDLRRGQQLLEVVLHRTIDLDGGTLVTAQLS
jgi:hypothetical protein